MRFVVLLVLGMLSPAALAADDARPHVYLVIVDGLAADAMDASTMPRLFDAAIEPVRMRTRALAVMPTRTNPNHVTLLSGLYPESHGITGNAYWSRRPDAAPGKLESAALLEAETLFTVAESTRPDLVTMAAFSKEKLGRLFEEAPGRQHAPDVVWVPEQVGGAERHTGLTGDAETMAAFLAATAEREPDLAVVNLGEVDRTSHMSGPLAAGEARRNASAAIGRLVDDLHARGRWQRSVLIVTSDHGFEDVRPTDARLDPSVDLAAELVAAGLSGLHVSSDGGVAHVYSDAIGPQARGAGPAASTLASAAKAAKRVAGVEEVFARLPVPGVPPLDPNWGLDHERAGDLVVVAAPGFQFVDPDDRIGRSFAGNHGSPREQDIPLVIAGGMLSAQSTKLAGGRRTSADTGATIAALLGLRAPRRFDGGAVRFGVPLDLTSPPPRPQGRRDRVPPPASDH